MLHTFATPPRGAKPTSGLIADSSGNLYGTASAGGASNNGVVYKLSAGRLTVLYNFTGLADGRYPNGVIRDTAGNLYGTAQQGGTAGAGVVFKIDTAGQETALYSFTGTSDGGNPQAGVIRDTAGNLYGTTSAGGASGVGVVFKLDTTGHETVLYNFTDGADGGLPSSGVVHDAAGNLYGTASVGGTGFGVVYKLDPGGTQTVLYRFTGSVDGGFPAAGVILDSAGNLYGTATTGGQYNAGVVYKVDPSGHETVLYAFTGSSDGRDPYAGVIRDSAGNLYGTTLYGGAGEGVVYELTASGQFNVLYSFAGGSGGNTPFAGVIRDAAGNLYGTTYYGGTGNIGVVYKVASSGTETLLYTFPQADGMQPLGGLVGDSSGNLYGTTSNGGKYGWGIVYMLDSAGHEIPLYSFRGLSDGGRPAGGVIRSSLGNLYGTTNTGGTAGFGTVYKVDATGHETVLHSFAGGTDGAYPASGVTADAAGNLYGTTVNGGRAGAGVVYKLDPAGNETVLYTFTGEADGGAPYGSVILDPAGNLYGTTSYWGGLSGEGVVYKLDTTGHETVLYTFTGRGDGGNPNALALDSAGNLYGTAWMGGVFGLGVVFELDTAGNETVLHSFTGGADGGYPLGLIRDRAGELYGTTGGGGGVVFEMDPDGNETVLYSFTNGSDGSLPNGELLRDSAGNLYGSTQQGGSGNAGVMFQIKP